MSLASNLATLGALMKTNLETKGVSGLNSNMGLTTLANKILDIYNKSLYLFSDAPIIQSGDTINIYAALSVNGRELVRNQNIDLTLTNLNPEYVYNHIKTPSAQGRTNTLLMESPCTFSWIHTRAGIRIYDDDSQQLCAFLPDNILTNNNISTPALCNLVWDGAGYLKFYINGVDYTSAAQSEGLSSYHAQGGIKLQFDKSHPAPIVGVEVSDVSSLLDEYPHGIYVEKVINTGNDGVASFSYTGFGGGDINLSAEAFVLYYDGGVIGNHNDNVFVNINGFTRNTNDTTVNRSSQTYTDLIPIGTGVTIELDVTEVTYGGLQIARYESGKSTTYHDVSLSTNGTGHYTIENTPNSLVFKKDGTTLANISNPPQTNCRFFFITNASNQINFKYKNLKIYYGSSLLQETYELIDAIYYDNATSDKSSNYYFNPSGGTTLTYSNGYYVLGLGTSGNYVQLGSITDNVKGKTVNFDVDFVLDGASTRTEVYVDNTRVAYSPYSTTNSTLSIQNVSIPSNATSVFFRISRRYTDDGDSIKFKNFKIYPI